MLRDGLAKCRCVADLDADKPKAVNIGELSGSFVVPRISGHYYALAITMPFVKPYSEDC